ncbi:hypothetical protein [Gloeobacter kilaueensis]|nr:hypothetical protein [Gloeobacter kilaueensis]
MSDWTAMGEEYSQSLEADVFAATLRMGLADTRDLLEFLAQKFELALPEQTTVRRGGWLFAREHPVEDLSLDFDEYQYQISRQGHALPVARIQKRVRGVVLKTTELPIEEWLSAVAAELARQAERSEITRRALDRFVNE